MSEIDKSQNEFTKRYINLMKKKSDYVFNLFLFFYLIFGFYLSTNTGISIDESVDQYIWKLNVEAIKYFFGYNENGYLNLLEFQDRFHGAGFHYISNIYVLIAGIFVELEKFSEETTKILLSHNLIFLTFSFRFEETLELKPKAANMNANNLNKPFITHTPIFYKYIKIKLTLL